MTALVLTGPSDLRDSRWLDEQTAIVTAGIETVQSVREAAIAIWGNWSQGRNVGRFHPKVTAGEYIESIVGHVRLPKPERNELIAALSGSGMSTREVARVAGVSDITVRRTPPATNVAPVSPGHDRVTGADGKSYPRPAPVTRVPVEDGANVDEEGNTETFNELMAALRVIEELSGSEASDVATAIPARRRAATAKKLRKLGGYLGSIAWHLEQLEG